MAILHLLVDDSLMAKVDSLFSSLGMDTSTAVRIFLASSIENNGLPFDVRHKTDPLSLETAVSDSRNRTNLHGPFKTAQEAVSSMLEDSFVRDCLYKSNET